MCIHFALNIYIVFACNHSENEVKENATLRVGRVRRREIEVSPVFVGFFCIFFLDKSVNCDEPVNYTTMKKE